MQDSLKSVLGEAKSVLILVPSEPNFDEVASATSLYLALKQEEGPRSEASKEVNVYSPSPMIVEFNSLVGVNKIKNEIGNKNLAISFADYNPQGIEKVSWDIDNGQFKLTIVPKVNVAAPSADQVIVGYSGVAADLIIIVGGRDENSFPAIKTEDLKDAKLAHVGINQVNIPNKAISSLATTGSSISEVTANLIKGAGYKIEADMATNLLLGIEAATDSFGSPLTTAETFSLVAELMKNGGQRRAQGQNAMQDMNAGIPQGQMPTNVPASWTEPKIFKGTSVS